MKVTYEVHITFEDNTRVNFTGEGITEIQKGIDGVIRLRQNILIAQISELFKDYMRRIPTPQKSE